ncbi:hypothetical protein [Williamsia sterculiae]|uniref:hypothetical protein n=1 Tax=Williamsia sterculiae TaxID=1344003 RepID=UPI001F1C79C4|nr:hypothetical protein [Williamsia sterculiae]
MVDSRPDPGLARSWLLVAPLTDDGLAAADASDADALIVDLEDGLPDSVKTAGRARTTAWLRDHPAWVRISSRGTGEWSADIDALADLPGLRGSCWPSPHTAPMWS